MEDLSGGFLVPLQCLISSDTIGALIDRGGSTLQELFRETRASIDAIPSRDTPRALSERILTISGTDGDKDRAVRKLLGLVWKQYGKEDRDGGFFRILIPGASVSAVIGIRGTTIYRISNRSGAEIDIPKDCVMGTKDRAVNIRGSVLAIQEAVREIVSEIQRLVNKQELTKRDFPYRTNFPAGKDSHYNKDPSAGAEQADVTIQVPAEYDSGQSACMLISREEGDFLTSDEVIETVKQLESQHEVLVNLVEAPSPPSLVSTRWSKSRDLEWIASRSWLVSSSKFLKIIWRFLPYRYSR